MCSLAAHFHQGKGRWWAARASSNPERYKGEADALALLALLAAALVAAFTLHICSLIGQVHSHPCRQAIMCTPLWNPSHSCACKCQQMLPNAGYCLHQCIGQAWRFQCPAQPRHRGVCAGMHKYCLGRGVLSLIPVFLVKLSTHEIHCVKESVTSVVPIAHSPCGREGITTDSKKGRVSLLTARKGGYHYWQQERERITTESKKGGLSPMTAGKPTPWVIDAELIGSARTKHWPSIA